MPAFISHDFDPNDVIEYYKKHEFCDIMHCDLIDYVPIIRKKDKDLLRSWRRHFQGKKRPYAVTEKERTEGDNRKYLYWSIWVRDLTK